HNSQVGKARPFLHDFLPAPEERAIDCVAGKRADQAAGNSAGGTEYGFAGGGTGGGKNKCGHQPVTPGNRNANAIRRRHHGASATSTTAAPSCACTITSGAVTIAACLAGKLARQRNSRTSPAAKSAGGIAIR